MKQIQIWERDLTALTAEFTNEFGGMTGEEINWKPNPNSWSVAQVVDHLIRINESYYPVMEQAKAGEIKLPFFGKFGFMQRFFGNFILKSVQPDNRKKIRTFPIWEPSTSNLDPDILQVFAGHQNELIEWIQSSKDLLEKNTIIYSPANKNIVYPLETAFNIIVTHEKRHLIQAKEIKSLIPSTI